jgi:hypothetical protein
MTEGAKFGSGLLTISPENAVSAVTLMAGVLFNVILLHVMHFRTENRNEAIKSAIKVTKDAAERAISLDDQNVDEVRPFVAALIGQVETNVRENLGESLEIDDRTLN